MKIAITGGTAGIGEALANEYQTRGHEVLRLSRRTGHNIRSIPKISDAIEPCDMFINNAQAGFAQTELLFEIANRWQGTKKHIVVISTMMTQYPVSLLPDLDAYRVQKTALEEAIKQLRNRRLKIKLTVVRPGMIGTAPERPVPPAADVDNWASTLVEIFDISLQRNLAVSDISLGPV